mmetsp:Transcript_92439/g.264945  ORF Transcript_92439/g.264945 Transcript_92439/m.264945 type:complete len:88 (-) Transcript_92439:37-300(-)
MSFIAPPASTPYDARALPRAPSVGWWSLEGCHWQPPRWYCLSFRGPAQSYRLWRAWASPFLAVRPLDGSSEPFMSTTAGIPSLREGN